MPRTASVSSQFPRGSAKFAATVAGLFLAAFALTACGSTQYPKAGDCIEESAAVTDDAPTVVDCKSDDAVSKVVAVDDDPADTASQADVAADVCEGQSGGEAYVVTETEKKKAKKGKKRKTVTENDWAACVVKA